jgi:hypothetical protein
VSSDLQELSVSLLGLVDVDCAGDVFDTRFEDAEGHAYLRCSVVE